MDLPGRKLHAVVQRRGDTAMGVQFAGRRVALSSQQHGFSLIELVLTMTVMTILTMGVIPLVKVAVKRQKEQALRETLRQMREAIDQFHREAVRSPCTGLTTGVAGQVPGQGQGQPGAEPPPDPRAKLVISDSPILGVEDP